MTSGSGGGAGLSVPLQGRGVNLGLLLSVHCRLSFPLGVNPKTLNEVNRSPVAGVVSIAIIHVHAFLFAEAKAKSVAGQGWNSNLLPPLRVSRADLSGRRSQNICRPFQLALSVTKALHARGVVLNTVKSGVCEIRETWMEILGLS